MRRKMLNKHEGKVATFIPLFFILFLLVIISYSLQMRQYEFTKTYTEDALAASNLASAVIDIREYGISRNILVVEPGNAYEIYKDALMSNMGLDIAMKKHGIKLEKTKIAKICRAIDFDGLL